MNLDTDAIADSLKALLENEPDLQGVPIIVEKPFAAYSDKADGWIAIYAKDWSPVREPLAMGRTMDVGLGFEVWCWGKSFGEGTEKYRVRNRIMGVVMSALMRQRAAGGSDTVLLLNGGRFESAADPDSGRVLATGASLNVTVVAEVIA